MTQLHYFTVKEDLQIEWVNVGDPYGLLEQQVEQWLTACDVRDYIKTKVKEHNFPRNITGLAMARFDPLLIGIEAPTWSFRNEADAIAFRVAFGDVFDYQLCDEWDDNEW